MKDALNPAAADRTLSVIVTITDGAPHLGRCLRALQQQQNAPEFEVVVPFHPALDSLYELRQRYSSVRWVEIPHLPIGAGSGHAGVAHLIYDIRRAAGLSAATGDIVAITEDHAIPGPLWCSRLMEWHRQKPNGVVGGAIDYAGRGCLGWSLYLCDFAKYSSPVKPGVVGSISDVNVSYKRATLEKTRDTWRNLYHETAVHGRMRAEGEELWLASGVEVSHDRGELRLRRVLAERFAWARLFAARRFPNSAGRRALHAIASPLLPAVLIGRRALGAIRYSPHAVPFLRALPMLAVLCTVWAAGEFTGYASGCSISGRSEGERLGF